MLITPRMRLIPATAELVRAELADRAAFARMLAADVPDAWPPELLVDALPWFLRQLEAAPELAGWLAWYGIARGEEPSRSVLVASAGFMGRPEGGSVEVGYSVLPQFQRRGFASEMVAGLARWAFAQDGVARIYAEIHQANEPSLRLARALGFADAGPGREPRHLHFELLRAP